ncbi:MAG: tRNA uridine-5-carboxymethylaminomethyl(34) synthesis GTPase MnmE, partial [Lentimicrobiaceae bacterium]|nr:tRNA uridine-5-carboxymethylaminomethyl(34) synthesis GTPase MnmE [Lentimicrobiaceae bacterium]
MNLSFLHSKDTICALSTSPGTAAIAVVRLSGPRSISICDVLFRSRKENFTLTEAESHTIHFGDLYDNDDILDEVVVSVFRAPRSYTGEDIVEISCHGSLYIQQRVLELLIGAGARLAGPGEFTFRAFMHGRFDLSQAEAVADLVAANSESSHQLAIQQMRGG